MVLAAGFCFGTSWTAFAEEATAPNYNWPQDESVIPGQGNLRNNAWFKKHFKDRRDGFWKNHAEKQNAIVFLGDSITEGWDHRLERDFPEFKVVSRGISGDVTRTVIYRLKEDVMDLNPRAVVLLIGTNDLDENNIPEDIAANTIQIMEKLKEYNPNLPVIFCKIMPRSQAPDFRTSFIIISNKIVSDYIAKANNPHWYIADTWSAYATPKGVVDKSNMKDFLHPVSNAYIKWRDLVKPILTELNLEDPSKFTPIFNGTDLTGWTVVNGGDWKVEDGALVGSNGRNWSSDSKKCGTWLRSAKQYGDFTLKLEYSINKNGNSGIFFRSGLENNPSYNGYEMQILDGQGKAPTSWGVCSIYDLVTPLVNPVRPADEWNDVTISAYGDKITIFVNGQKTIEIGRAHV